jgi:hypothetical protein
MGCNLTEQAPERDEYQDAVIDLHFLYDLLRVEGKDADSDFMKGIKYAHNYLTNKQK